MRLLDLLRPNPDKQAHKARVRRSKEIRAANTIRAVRRNLQKEFTP